jgi:hypothetical protein
VALVGAAGAFVLAAAAGIPVVAQAPTIPRDALARVVAELEPEIRRAMLDGGIPSLTIAMTDRSAELWSGAYGISNREARGRNTVARAQGSCAVRPRNDDEA